jgi:lysophospholipase L1-like esterase
MMRRLFGSSLLAVLVWSFTGCVDLQPVMPEVRYVAFGDSATRGPSDRDYPEQLAELLGIEAEAIVNAGDGGERIADGRARLADLIASDIYPNANTLLFWQGGNDLIDLIGEIDPFLFWSPSDPDYPFDEEVDPLFDQIAGDLEAAIQLGRQNGWAVFVATYYPIQSGFSSCSAVPLNVLLPGQAERANEYVDRLNERIRLIAIASGAKLVDVARELPDVASDPANYHNCNHLSATGNRLAAEVFADAIQSP